jgi:hypothetical protein
MWNIFSPSFIWPYSFQVSSNLKMQPLPRTSPYLIRRFWARVHKLLVSFSHKYYCRWYNIPFDNQIVPLPFGLLLKWSDGTRIEEVLAMQAARKAGMPVPRVICYGEHPTMPHAPVSILMTRLPGRELGQVYEELSSEAQATVLRELQAYLSSIRKWKNPWGENRICSTSGTSIRSVRIPFHKIGPCDTEQEFHNHLLKWADPTHEDYRNLRERAQELCCQKHAIVYTHGDLKPHNVLVHHGHVSGFIDWEAAGWYPEYWEYTTALRYVPKDTWYFDFVLKLSGGKYVKYREAESALIALTVDSWAW